MFRASEATLGHSYHRNHVSQRLIKVEAETWRVLRVQPHVPIDQDDMKFIPEAVKQGQQAWQLSSTEIPGLVWCGGTCVRKPFCPDYRRSPIIEDDPGRDGRAVSVTIAIVSPFLYGQG